MKNEPGKKTRDDGTTEEIQSTSVDTSTPPEDGSTPQRVSSTPLQPMASRTIKVGS
jgi:hypothetical protein